MKKRQERERTGTTQRAGLAAAVGASLLWGCLPVYWKALSRVPALEIICHRIIWSMVFTLAILAAQGRLRQLWRELTIPVTRLTFLATSLLVAVNWLTYIWAVNNDYIVEASLGYFINPLVSALLGVVVLKERLRPGQWLALALAASGVGYLALSHGRIPWIALVLAGTFSLYSLLRKTARLPSLEGLFCETCLLSLPAAALLLLTNSRGTASFAMADPTTMILLICSGIATSAPLLLFVYGAQRIHLTALGLLQYLAPTLQLLLGIFLYHEPFPREKGIGFVLVWTALGLYTLEGILWRKGVRR
ncbi:EamA family transporter RarD [Desulfolithobacter dissulfuricans]|uniref:EamA family transporter RarD n=1 Tax=Desulfolithobacter dissulfuricans TaxID=2795293 RepID=UPI002279532A|nr:EamA family transporter RarD [Desulfolithobacter dissulfuricans]